VRVILALRLIGFNRVNPTNFANLTALNVHVFTAFGNLTQMRPLTYTARSLLQPQFEIEGDLRLRSGRALCVFGHSACGFAHRYGQHIFDDTLSDSRPSRNTAIQDDRECPSGERIGTANALTLVTGWWVADSFTSGGEGLMKTLQQVRPRPGGPR